MDELRRTQAESTMAQPQFSRSMAEIDHSQVGLTRFLDPNEISQPPHERMTKLETAMAELKRVHAKCATSQVQFMKLTRADVSNLACTIPKLERRDDSKGHFLYSTWIRERTT